MAFGCVFDDDDNWDDSVFDYYSETLFIDGNNRISGKNKHECVKQIHGAKLRYCPACGKKL